MSTTSARNSNPQLDQRAAAGLKQLAIAAAPLSFSPEAKAAYGRILVQTLLKRKLCVEQLTLRDLVMIAHAAAAEHADTVAGRTQP